MGGRKQPHERKPHHIAGQTVYVQLRTYDPATKQVKHRGIISLKRWDVAEVRDIIIDAFTARQVQRGEQDPEHPLTWTGGHLN